MTRSGARFMQRGRLWNACGIGGWRTRGCERTAPGAFNGWNAAVRTLDRLDPHDVFTSPLLRALLRTR